MATPGNVTLRDLYELQVKMNEQFTALSLAHEKIDLRIAKLYLKVTLLAASISAVTSFLFHQLF